MEDGPGLIVIQIDGMSRPALDDVLSSGRMPVLSALVSSGQLMVDRWVPLLPSCTPASQAGILHGDNDGIPGFRWFEKATGRLLVANRPKDAAEIERRLSNGGGLLARGGVSVGNLLAGDAAFSHLTMATLGGDDRAGGPRDSGGYPLDPRSYLRIIFEMISEVVHEIVQARRQRQERVRPRMRRGWRFALERVVVNVPLRILSTSMVIHEVQRGRPVIYVDYAGYDEVAHHCGAGRPESYGAAEEIDRSIGHILDAVVTAPRPYRLVVLSDHGQSLGATFRQRYGITLVQFIARQIGEGTTYDDVALRSSEYADGLTRISHHVLGFRAAAAIEGLLERRPGTRHQRTGRVGHSHGAPLASPADAQVADVVVCASGNLGLVYFTSSPGRMTREGIESRYPGLIDSLVRHPGIGMLVLRSERGVVAIGAGGTNLLDEDRIIGGDPLTSYGPTAAAGLRRIAGFEDSGDMIAIGRYDPATDEVVSIEELVGSHGGLGGRQGEAFIAYPPSWHLDGRPLVGAPAVNIQLRRWMSDLRIGASVTSYRARAGHAARAAGSLGHRCHCRMSSSEQRPS
jgi:hypothetical protein